MLGVRVCVCVCVCVCVYVKVWVHVLKILLLRCNEDLKSFESMETVKTFPLPIKLLGVRWASRMAPGTSHRA